MWDHDYLDSNLVVTYFLSLKTISLNHSSIILLWYLNSYDISHDLKDLMHAAVFCPVFLVSDFRSDGSIGLTDLMVHRHIQMEQK